MQIRVWPASLCQPIAPSSATFLDLARRCIKRGLAVNAVVSAILQLRVDTPLPYVLQRASSCTTEDEGILSLSMRHPTHLWSVILTRCFHRFFWPFLFTWLRWVGSLIGGTMPRPIPAPSRQKPFLKHDGTLEFALFFFSMCQR